ncbi:uncharacterized protein LOC129588741 [Paramacrobiotus metropolitanus]|uniref:uncharacterized protein LOC129588741 n=1 Tax=Paramacrobiotus metropolitanus TaxID=2943436 RepID=UPI002445B5C3|nr:uncharacterized protein LOC129588741 [Paramacrobiotus metropolitanus]
MELRTARLVLYNRHLTVFGANNRTFGDYCADVARSYTDLSPWCPRIIWSNVSLCYNKYDCEIEFRIRYAYFDLDNIDAVQFWNMFEASLAPAEPLDANRVEEWIAEEADCKQCCKRIIGMLTAFQSCDPRHSAQYSKHEWTQDGLRNVDVRKLNRVCLYAACRLWCRHRMSCARRRRALRALTEVKDGEAVD